MKHFRIALANVRAPNDRNESVEVAEAAIREAGERGAQLVAFPECFVPGYRIPGGTFPPPDPAFLERAWSTLAAASARAKITSVVGTERIEEGALRASVIVIDEKGSIAGFQDKVQIDPSEEGIYVPAKERRVFEAGPLTFGIVICHEGWRYPETVRWAVRRGAQLVLHPHFHVHEEGAFVPTRFADPKNTFHEKAILCRAAENTCWVASINAAIENAPTTSAIAAPDGTLFAHHPYGEHGLLVADIDLERATRLLAARLAFETIR